MLAVFTMWPSPWPARIGRNARTPWTTPQRFTPSTHCQLDTGPNHESARLATPALLQTTWTAPKRLSAADASACTAASSLTSVGTVIASTPMPVIVSAAVLRPPSSTSASTTLRPLRANRSASASPIPLAAPVTTATRPGVSSMGRT